MRALILAATVLLGTVAVPGDAATIDRPCTRAELDAIVNRAPDAPPPGTDDCAGVYPGMRLFTTSTSNEPMSCVAGVMFRGSDGRTYVSAPGRCLLKPRYECVGSDLPLTFPLPVDIPVCLVIDPPYSDEEPVFGRGRGVPVRDAAGRRIGEWAYAVYQEEYDFGLIRLDTNVGFTPRVCYWGGPTGMESAVRTTPELLLVTEENQGTWAVAARGLYALSAFGFTYDDLGWGGVVLTEQGKAVGGFDAVTYLGTGRVVQRYPLALERARTKTRATYTLLTAPLRT